MYRLARVLDKEGQRDKGRHAFALAAAAGGGDVAASRDRSSQLGDGSDAADKEIAQAGIELLQMRTIKLPAIAGGTDSAQFVLIFDGSNKPDRVEWLDGNVSLRSAADKLREKEYAVKFPDASSVKIVRQATLSCEASACFVVLLPLKGLQTGIASTAKK